MKMQFSLGHMATGMTRERLRKELPDSRLLEVKIFLRNQSNCAIAFVQARTVCMQDLLPSGFRDQCLAQGNNFPSCHFLESRLSGSLFCGSTFCGSQRGGVSKARSIFGESVKMWPIQFPLSSKSALKDRTLMADPGKFSLT